MGDRQCNKVWTLQKQERPSKLSTFWTARWRRRLRKIAVCGSQSYAVTLPFLLMSWEILVAKYGTQNRLFREARRCSGLPIVDLYRELKIMQQGGDSISVFRGLPIFLLGELFLQYATPGRQFSSHERTIFERSICIGLPFQRMMPSH